MTNEININGTTYAVVTTDSPAEYEGRGLMNIARIMRENKVARHFIATRKNGRRHFMVSQFENGNFSKPKALPYI